jgi:hypothetical protein
MTRPGKRRCAIDITASRRPQRPANGDIRPLTVDDAPFSAIVMTAPEHKGYGLGRAVVAASLESLRTARHRTVTLYITEGNAPSERLFASLGAVEVADPR